MNEQKIYRYTGSQIHVDWDERLCIHMGECGYASGDLFVTGRDPWCQPDLSSPDEICSIIQRCPSGALSCCNKQGENLAPAATENQITVSYKGPYFCQGQLEIDGAADDMPGVRHRAALCRCGLSANKPFCDNSHEGQFEDYGAVGETGTDQVSATGPLNICPISDGPLIISGKLKLYASSGRLAWQGNELALCRCGASSNKPFCDGSHSAINFKG